MPATTGTAGGKSLLSYRYDNAIPGYTGFLSAGACLSLPTKGSTVHTGKPATDTEIQHWAGKQQPKNESEYKNTYTAQQKDYYPSRTEGGQWQAQRFGEVVTDARCHYSSTYKDEIQKSAQTAKKAQTVTEGLRTTIAMEKQAQAMVKNGTVGPSKTLGYTSVYTSMVLKDPLTGGLAAPGREPQPKPDLSEVYVKEKVIRRTIEPTFHGDSMYSKSFGAFGSDPLDHSAQHESEMPKMATTKELNIGSHQATGHIPGYSGFLPRFEYNPKAIEKAHIGDTTRGDQKAKMLLVSMDQYSRHLMPKYGGFRAQDVTNMHGEELPPTTRTHQGSVNQDVWKSDPPPQNKASFLTSKDGTLSFFTGGAGAVSENGKSLAQCYYLAVRPKEGLPRIFYPSKTTHWGSQWE